MPKYIAIEGMLGVGKTRLAQTLAERLSARLILDQVDSNPFLLNYQMGERRLGFQTQLYFLLTRYQQQQVLRQEDLFHSGTITDYIFAKDQIFADLTLEASEQSLYKQIHRRLISKIPGPDLVIFLDARPQHLIQRITQRKNTRVAQTSPTPSLEFLERLHAAYAEYFFGYDQCPLLMLKADEEEQFENEFAIQELIRTLPRLPKGVTHLDLSRFTR